MQLLCASDGNRKIRMPHCKIYISLYSHVIAPEHLKCKHKTPPQSVTFLLSLCKCKKYSMKTIKNVDTLAFVVVSSCDKDFILFFVFCFLQAGCIRRI